ncbi:hypothetical protein C8D78_1951 [Arthrobacter oryzae]|uniref:Uncharacterized protein n=1 Tax=Arthrobacter oryzae TaxID=409290 RepID=A0A495EUU9_9MICC|nr:hypothetical protein C8D78_1951 [Arthrobacter oryzae]
MRGVWIEWSLECAGFELSGLRCAPGIPFASRDLHSTLRVLSLVLLGNPTFCAKAIAWPAWPCAHAGADARALRLPLYEPTPVGLVCLCAGVSGIRDPRARAIAGPQDRVWTASWQHRTAAHCTRRFSCRSAPLCTTDRSRSAAVVDSVPKSSDRPECFLHQQEDIQVSYSRSLGASAAECTSVLPRPSSAGSLIPSLAALPALDGAPRGRVGMRDTARTRALRRGNSGCFSSG